MTWLRNFDTATRAEAVRRCAKGRLMTDTPTLLLVGASRGLGLAIAEEFAKRGWSVVGTVRGEGRTALHELAERYPGRIEIERLDVTDAGQISALRERLDGRRFDILFVNAGVASSDRDETAGSAETDEFVRLMVTNALAPRILPEPLKSYCATLLLTVTVPEEIAAARFTVVWAAVSSKTGVAAAKKLAALP